MPIRHFIPLLIPWRKPTELSIARMEISQAGITVFVAGTNHKRNCPFALVVTARAKPSGGVSSGLHVHRPAPKEHMRV